MTNVPTRGDVGGKRMTDFSYTMACHILARIVNSCVIVFSSHTWGKRKPTYISVSVSQSIIVLQITFKENHPCHTNWYCAKFSIIRGAQRDLCVPWNSPSPPFSQHLFQFLSTLFKLLLFWQIFLLASPYRRWNVSERDSFDFLLLKLQTYLHLLPSFLSF